MGENLLDRGVVWLEGEEGREFVCTPFDGIQTLDPGASGPESADNVPGFGAEEWSAELRLTPAQQQKLKRLIFGWKSTRPLRRRMIRRARNLQRFIDVTWPSGVTTKVPYTKFLRQLSLDWEKGLDLGFWKSMEEQYAER